MRLIIVQLFLFLAIISGQSQEWSGPKVISTGGYNYNPDFTVDRSHVIHCVWSHRLGENFAKIYYSRSSDHGSTWSPPCDISLNTIRWMDNPHIVADSFNRLHVTYDFNTGDYTATKIAHIYYNGSTWSAPVFISDSLPGPARHNRLAIDHNGKVYCFWFHGNIVYRTLENGVWGSYRQPYPGDHDIYFLNRIVISEQNDLYCVGIHHYEGQTSYDDRAIGFSMKNGIWGDFVELSDSMCWENTDVALISGDLPVYVWGQLRRDTVISQTANYFAEMTPSSMTAPLMLSTDANEAAITTDLNLNIHIVDAEKKSDSVYHLVSYFFNPAGWSKSIIQSGNRVYAKNLLKSDDTTIYLVSQRLENNDPNTLSIVFAKKEVAPTGFHKTQPVSFRLFPNPFSGHLTVKVDATSGEDLTIGLNDCLGRPVSTVYQGTSFNGSGTYSVDVRGLGLPPGIYFVQVRLGERLTSKKIIYLPDRL